MFTNGAGTVATNPASLVVAAGSTNWSGYAALDPSFRSVTASWRVPAVTCPGTATTYSSQWIGIDGAENGDNTVEQDGTESDCLGGVPTYDAWYEMYGDPAVNNGDEVELSPSIDHVSPGDAMTASVSLTGSTWTLAISDTTAGWQSTAPVTLTLARTGAVLSRVDCRAARGERIAVVARGLRHSCVYRSRRD